MGKVMLVFFITFFNNFCFSQSYPQNWVYEEVVFVDSTVKTDELHARAKLFIATAFKSSKDVLQLDDVSNQILVVKGNIQAYIKVLGMKGEHGWVNFSLKVQSKDGRYKYTISDFNHEISDNKQVSIGSLDKEKPGGGLYTIGKNNFEELKGFVHDDIRKFVLELKLGMQGSRGKVKDDF